MRRSSERTRILGCSVRAWRLRILAKPLKDSTRLLRAGVGVS